MRPNEARSEREVDISVVIVSWNTRDLLDACLRSIEAEATLSGISVETIVVDNASTDGTPASITAAFPEVMLIPLEENRGFAAANNLGIRRARGAAILLLNPDTELLSGALDALRRALEATPHVGLVGPRLLNPDDSLQAAGFAFPGLRQIALDFFPLHPRLVTSRLNGRIGPGDGQSPIAIDHPLGACMLVRRSAIDQAGLLDERYFMYSEEIDWCRRLKAAGWTILLAPAARVVHHGGQSTRQMAERMFVELHRSRARYFRRYHSPRMVRAAATLAALAARRAERQARQGGYAEAAHARALRAAAARYAESEPADA